MAKDLPYFKFFVSEWNDGDITLEEYKIQGLFINICSYYWSNECVLNKKRLYKRFKNDIKDIEYLIEEGFIKLCDDYVNISFLNEQKEDNKDRSAKNSNSGKISAMKREINNIISFIKENSNEDLTSVEKLLNEKPTSVKKLLNIKSTIKIREEKIREENKREDNIKKKPKRNPIESETKGIREEKIREEKTINNSNFFEDCLKSSQWLETTSMQNKIDIDVTKLWLKNFIDHLISMEEQKINLKEFKQHFVYWLKKQDLSNFRRKIIGKTNQV